MFGKGKGLFGRGHKGKSCPKHRCRRRGCGFPLSDAEIGCRYSVILNPDKKTIEMGIFNGSIITVHKNESIDQNIVVGVGNSRYIIPKIIADKIVIQ